MPEGTLVGCAWVTLAARNTQIISPKNKLTVFFTAGHNGQAMNLNVFIFKIFLK